jgi:hypothetical protein
MLLGEYIPTIIFCLHASHQLASGIVTVMVKTRGEKRNGVYT